MRENASGSVGQDVIVYLQLADEQLWLGCGKRGQMPGPAAQASPWQLQRREEEVVSS